MGMKKIPLLNNETPSGTADTPNVTIKKGGFDHSTPESTVEMTEELVLDALKGVRDPELPIDIVNLGLVYDVQFPTSSDVHVKMTLTTPGCAMGKHIAMQAEEAVKAAGAREVLIEIVWDPPWNPDMVTDEGKQKLGIT